MNYRDITPNPSGPCDDFEGHTERPYRICLNCGHEYRNHAEYLPGEDPSAAFTLVNEHGEYRDYEPNSVEDPENISRVTLVTDGSKSDYLSLSEGVRTEKVSRAEALYIIENGTRIPAPVALPADVVEVLTTDPALRDYYQPGTLVVKGVPKVCPVCGTPNPLGLVDWEARSLEPTDRDNTATLTEYQCLDAENCGTSFWM